MLPLVAPLFQNSWRLRLQNQVVPVSSVRCNDSWFMYASISTSPVSCCCTIAGIKVISWNFAATSDGTLMRAAPLVRAGFVGLACDHDHLVGAGAVRALVEAAVARLQLEPRPGQQVFQLERGQQVQREDRLGGVGHAIAIVKLARDGEVHP